eukprot:scaffold246_cov414-Prasinococcus_capsulatus_cf.AAC.12
MPTVVAFGRSGRSRLVSDLVYNIVASLVKAGRLKQTPSSDVWVCLESCPARVGESDNAESGNSQEKVACACIEVTHLADPVSEGAVRASLACQDREGVAHFA